MHISWMYGKYTISNTFNVSDLSSFNVGDQDLRANTYQENGNDSDIEEEI